MKMKTRQLALTALALAFAFALAGLTACAAAGESIPLAAAPDPAAREVTAPTPAAPEITAAPAPAERGEIFLYGEIHGAQAILDKELALWRDYYHNAGMRHLFVEDAYYTAALLNVWMAAEDDSILDALYDDWAGTQSQTPAVKDFYQRIKRECPETVFHGTDIGHQYATTGERYLAYLRENGAEGSEAYAEAEEVIQQGRHYYGAGERDARYREDKMVRNFTRALDALGGESVMGVYGAAHTSPEDFTQGTDDHPNMANQLRQLYGAYLHTEDLRGLAVTDTPLGADTLTIGGKTYEAVYFGEQDLTPFGIGFTARAFWRVENAYDDFAAKPKTGEVLPYDNYPMPIESGQIFVIDYTRPDGSTERRYYRSDGNEWQGQPTTEGFEGA